MFLPFFPLWFIIPACLHSHTPLLLHCVPPPRSPSLPRPCRAMRGQLVLNGCDANIHTHTQRLQICFVRLFSYKSDKRLYKGSKVNLWYSYVCIIILNYICLFSNEIHLFVVCVFLHAKWIFYFEQNKTLPKISKNGKSQFRRGKF